MANQYFLDQLGRKITLHCPPQRIISLVPSQTELLFALGLENEVVGITKFCIHPKAWFQSKTRIGGTKDVNLERVRALRPDLVIANKEENDAAQVAALAAEFPVWVSSVDDLNSALSMIGSIAALTDRQEIGAHLCHTITREFAGLRPAGTKSVVYIIWNEPLMAAGPDTFIHDMLRRCGFSNCIAQPRYPTVLEETLEQLAPQVILLSSEPFPFSDKHVKAMEHRFPSSRIVLVDGEMFSWYGSRLTLAPAYFQKLQDELNG
jgi:ABC-type Fe3+-hydroxamate transport system substrate-binding protein